MNDGEREKINDGDKFALPDGFLKSNDPARWLKERQLELKPLDQRVIEAMQDHAAKQKPKHRGPEE